MKTTFMETRIQMAGIIAHLIGFAQQIAESDQKIDDETAKLIAVTMAATTLYGKITLTIINDPDVILPPQGRRCIFY